MSNGREIKKLGAGAFAIRPRKTFVALVASALAASTLVVAPAASAAAPVVTSCELYTDGSGARIYVDQHLGQGIDDVQSHYEILIDKVSSGVTYARTYSSTISILFANRVMASTQSASIVYTRNTSGGLQNADSEFLGSFTCSLSPSNVGPSAVSAGTDSAGTQITITADQDIEAGDSFVRSPSSWYLDTGSSNISISSVAVSGRQVTLTLASSAQHTDNLRLFFYAAEAEEPMPVRYFWTANHQLAVTNNVPAPTPAQNPTPTPTPTSPAPVVTADPEPTTQLETPVAPAGTASIKRVGDSVRIFVLDPAGLGKVQFKINGREIAWVRAIDASDPKLRQANGRSYFVRTKALAMGKNAVEIFIDSERVKRVAYTR